MEVLVTAEAARGKSRVHVCSPAHCGCVDRVRGRARTLVTHENRVAPGDDSTPSLVALLVVLIQEHVANVVGRGSSVYAVTREVVHVRDSLVGLGGCGHLWRSGDGVHLMHAVHMLQERGTLVSMVIVTESSGTSCAAMLVGSVERVRETPTSLWLETRNPDNPWSACIIMCLTIPVCKAIKHLMATQKIINYTLTWEVGFPIGDILPCC